MRLVRENLKDTKVDICFWCGESKEELPRDAVDLEAEMSYIPCTKCEAQFDQGVLIIQSHSSRVFDNQIPVRKNPDLYPTGIWVVVAEEIMKELIPNTDLLAEVLMHRRLCISIQEWHALGFTKAIVDAQERA